MSVGYDSIFIFFQYDINDEENSNDTKKKVKACDWSGMKPAGKYIIFSYISSLYHNKGHVKRQII